MVYTRGVQFNGVYQRGYSVMVYTRGVQCNGVYQRGYSVMVYTRGVQCNDEFSIISVISMPFISDTKYRKGQRRWGRGCEQIRHGPSRFLLHTETVR